MFRRKVRASTPSETASKLNHIPPQTSHAHAEAHRRSRVIETTSEASDGRDMRRDTERGGFRSLRKVNVVLIAAGIACITAPDPVGAQHSHEHGAPAATAEKPASTGALEADSSVAAGTDHVMNGRMVAGLHMEMTPSRPMTAAGAQARNARRTGCAGASQRS